MANCNDCATKDAIIEQQRREILRLQRIIKKAQTVCLQIIGSANQIMSGNQPRGKWAYAKGQKEAAEDVFSALE